jgi:glycine/D-amino acid oxidase-like deaminating enzyme
MHQPTIDLRGEPVVVIGAGIVGATIAYRLAQVGVRVIVVDPLPAGSAASGNSLAGLTEFGLDEPTAALPMWARAIEAYRDLADELPGDWLHLDGSIVWLEGATTVPKTARQREAGTIIPPPVRQLFDRPAASGSAVETITRSELASLEPELVLDDAVTRIVHRASEGWLDAPMLCNLLIDAAVTRYRALVHRSSVSAIEPARDGATVVLGDASRHAATLVINAAGADGSSVAALAGAELALVRRPGAFIVTSPTRVRIHHLLQAPTVNVRPEPGGRLVAQRDTDDGQSQFDQTPAMGDALRADALAALTRILPSAGGASVDAIRFGIRPIPIDGEPIIGRDPQVPVLYHALMHSGIRRAAVVAEHVALELSGREAAPLTLYRPDRFAGNQAHALREPGVPVA